MIDTGPDFRAQMIDAGAHSLDAAVYTHPHADHIHGIDDLRTYVVENRRLMDVYANRLTRNRLFEAFGYCFETPAGSSYPPILSMHDIAPETPFAIQELVAQSVSSRSVRYMVILNRSAFESGRLFIAPM